MSRLVVMAARNLVRMWRRSLLTAGLIAIGILAVLLFVALAGSFRSMMIGQITDSYLGHQQVHRQGYVAAVESLPLNLNMPAAAAAAVERAAATQPDIVAVSPRVKFGAMFSNFTESTNIRVNGVDPAREAAVSTELAQRISEGERAGLLARGEILVPEIVARGLNVAVGDGVVVIATNRDGSVNGRTLRVRGILSGVTGPGGRDGYVHIDDARAILRMTEPEVSEFAMRVRSLDRVTPVVEGLQVALASPPPGMPPFEVHGWSALTPFASIARMIDVMTLFIRVLLVSIVLVAVMNVMVMAVYERIREIGTMAAIGTPPARILSLFLAEGVLLGLAGSVAGAAISVGAVAAVRAAALRFSFGQQTDLLLVPVLPVHEIVLVSAVVLLVAVAASLQPAWKAARMDPITALRHV